MQNCSWCARAASCVGFCSAQCALQSTRLQGPPYSLCQVRVGWATPPLPSLGTGGATAAGGRCCIRLHPSRPQPPAPCSTAKVGRGTVKVERNQDTGKTGPRQGTVRVDRRSSTARKQAGDDQAYFNVTGYPFPLGPITKRATIRKDIVRGIIWGFEQPQSLGGSNVTTNVRMTIVRLKSGGLWVHAPIAPTREPHSTLGTVQALTPAGAAGCLPSFFTFCLPAFPLLPLQCIHRAPCYNRPRCLSCLQASVCAWCDSWRMRRERRSSTSCYPPSDVREPHGWSSTCLLNALTCGRPRPLHPAVPLCCTRVQMSTRFLLGPSAAASPRRRCGWRPGRLLGGDVAGGCSQDVAGGCSLAVGSRRHTCTSRSSVHLPCVGSALAAMLACCPHIRLPCHPRHHWRSQWSWPINLPGESSSWARTLSAREQGLSPPANRTVPSLAAPCIGQGSKAERLGPAGDAV